MKNTPQLLDQLVKLTTIRDAELLDYSLLRTIQDLLQPLELALFRIDPAGRVSYLMRADAGSGPAIAAAEELPAARIQAALALPADCEVEREQLADGLQRVTYPIADGRGARSFLQVLDGPEASADDDRLIFGFLRFYTNYCNLLDYSQRDQLTGLMNRKTFDESVYKLFGQPGRIEQLILRAQSDERRSMRHAGSFWLGMVDIDHFKRINDSFGHLYGDEVLLLAAQLMRRCFRDGDLLFRFGGEEFVIVAQHTDLGGARAAFERLLAAVAAYPFPQVGRVTVSIGLVQMRPGSLTPVLLDQADKALYFAKQNGRNQLAVFEELRERGEIEESRLVSGSVDLF